jgi:hypothetical protein
MAKKSLSLEMVRGPTREPPMVDLLDRILDKGIVIDLWARLALAGLDLGIRFEMRVVVASIETYLKHFGPAGLLNVPWPNHPY